MSIRVKLEHKDGKVVLDQHVFSTLKSARSYAYNVLTVLPNIKAVRMSKSSPVHNPDWSNPSYVVRGSHGIYYLTHGVGNGRYVNADGTLSDREIEDDIPIMKMELDL